MAALSEMLRQVRQNEIDQAEAKLATEVNAVTGAKDFAQEYFKPELKDADDPRKQRSAELLETFTMWCNSKGVPSLPAKPTTVAAFILARRRLDADEKLTRNIVHAVERQHDIAGLPNPVATFAVRLALNKPATVEPPRSWPGAQKLMFAGLPREIQEVVSAREADRERALRRGQNEIAEMKKRLQEQMPQPKSAEQQKEDSNGKETRMEEGRGTVLEQ
jgi:hypothetical protein